MFWLAPHNQKFVLYTKRVPKWFKQKKFLISISITIIAIFIAGVAFSYNSFFPDEESLQEKQKIALLAFFERTGGKYWLNSSGWLSESGGDYCKWFGVACEPVYGQVLRIDLPHNNLTADDFEMSVLGPIESLLALTVHNNSINGDIARIANSAYEGFPQLHKLVLTGNAGLKGEVDCTQFHHGLELIIDCHLKCECCRHHILCNTMD